MAVVTDALLRPTTPLITSFNAAHDRNPNYYNHVSNRLLPCPITTSNSFRLHRITSQLPLHSFKSGHGCSWMQDNSTYKDNLTNCKRNPGSLQSVFPPTPAEVSSVKDLFEFICEGPLINKLGFTPEIVAESIDKWLQSGFHICKLFKLNELYLTTPQKARIYHYYIPVYLWCEKQIADHGSTFKDGDDIPPLVIGFSAPQGCGKTTLVFALDFLFHNSGRKSATISIDDFYLTYDDQAKLRETNPGNALLEFRGNAGSHDLSLSVETLTALGKLTKEGMKMKLPRYDKSAYNGRGDRADPSVWPEVEGPLTVVLFEGWMLGFKPVPAEVVKSIDQQAEIQMREAGNPGMTDEEVMDFVSRYLPAYNAYLPTLYTEGPKGSDSEHTLIVEIDEGRNPILAA